MADGSSLAGGRRQERAALAVSLGGHGALLLLMLAGSFVIPRQPVPTRLSIEAFVVTPAPRSTSRPAPAPQPVPNQADLERERAQAEARERRQAEQREAEERERREAEQRARTAAEATAKRERAEREQVERDRQAKARAEKLAAEAKAAEARRNADLKRQQQERAQLARQLAEEEKLLAATESGALDEYVALIRQKVERNWLKPPGARPGVECEVRVTQIPGGEVVGVQFGRCNGDEVVRRSIEAAVLRASPLPPPTDRALFERNLRFTFKPQE